MPLSSRSRSTSSATLGMSRVISSAPSLVSRASISYSSMWIEVSTSSRTSRSETMMASSKLWPSQGMNATRRFLPSDSSPSAVDGPSASTSPALTLSPTATTGFWFMQVPWLERSNLSRAKERFCPVRLSLTTMVSPSTSTTSPSTALTIMSPESCAARASTPVPTSGDSVLSSGTACRCMFEPISARLASSCSRKGMSAVATDTICLGDTSM